jgi:hypothetical protein
MAISLNRNCVPTLLDAGLIRKLGLMTGKEALAHARQRVLLAPVAKLAYAPCRLLDIGNFGEAGTHRVRRHFALP